MESVLPGRWCFGVEPLPDFAIRDAGDVGRDFAARGIHTFRAAARHVHRLPYGRTTDPRGYRAVLHQGRGTCSTKHALLSALAAEHEVRVELCLGLVEMTDHQAPGVGRVLRLHGIESIPEAHCYLRYDDVRIDLTSSRKDPVSAPLVLHEERIGPEQIGDYKRDVHRGHLTRWAVEHGFTADEAWSIREECILALEQEGQGSGA